MNAEGPCIFCDIANGRAPASIVLEDELTLAFMDLRQFHDGHVLVIPRAHIADIRSVDDSTAAALIVSTARVARAIDTAFSCEGLSVWHSAGEAANQEVPHLHFHVHPRFPDDDVFRVYPAAPALPDRMRVDELCARVREAMH